MAADLSILPIGKNLQGGKYKILKVLGQGGFGITYLAEQTGLGMKVAIKEFFLKGSCQRDLTTSNVRIPVSDNEELISKCLKKFKSEARKIASLSNDHIVNIIDIFDENGTSYYVMKYLNGGSLAERIKNKSLSEEEAIKIVKEIADALKSVHSNGLLHLDIKPANILFDEKGRAVLIDFGVSKYVDSQQDTTTTSSLIGFSRGFAPLEQFNATASSLTPAADIYALGATLYNMVMGITPPEASSIMDVGFPEMPESVSEGVKQTIIKAMQPRRKDRPQSISEFLALLDSSSKDKREETEEATIVLSPKQASNSNKRINASSNRKRLPFKPKPLLSLLGVIALAAVVSVFVANLFRNKGDRNVNSIPQLDSSSIVREASKKQQKSAGNKGSLNVISTPSGATIWLDGVNINKTTPALIEDVNIGEHTIELKLKGYDDYSNTFVLNSNERLFISPDLTISNARQVQSQTASNTQSDAFTQLNTGVENGHEWVDLGLSVKWATCNVGALTSEESGVYFAWGETSTKSVYSLESYEYGNDLRKYNNQDKITRIEISDDVANKRCGGRWRIPTKKEFDELRANCTFTKKEYTDGSLRIGFLVTSRINGNSIFLPATGSYEGSFPNQDKRFSDRIKTSYWTATRCLDPQLAYSFSLNTMSSSESQRYIGFTIRPVLDNR